MNGNELSLTIEKLDKKYGLFGMTQSDVVKYINMDRAELQALTIHECSEISFLLSSFSFFLKKEENRCLAISNRLQTEINRIVALDSKQYDKFTKYEDKVQLICENNDSAKSIKEELNLIDLEKNYLQFLSHQVQKLAESLIELKRAKYQREKHDN